MWRTGRVVRSLHGPGPITFLKSVPRYYRKAAPLNLDSPCGRAVRRRKPLLPRAGHMWMSLNGLVRPTDVIAGHGIQADQSSHGLKDRRPSHTLTTVHAANGAA
jgi:hypothetical protein